MIFSFCCKGKMFKSLLLTSLWLGFAITTAFTQNKQSNLIDFEASSERLSSVLQRLAKQEDINLTYNASDTAFSRTISFKNTAKTATQILTELLNQINFEYQQVGNDLVILKTNTSFEEIIFENNVDNTKQPSQNIPAKQREPSIRTDTIIKYVEVPVYTLDTVYIKDTVIREKEVIIRDTLILNTSGKGKRKISISDNVFTNNSSDAPGWHMEYTLTNALLSYQTIAANDIPISDSISSLEPVSFFNPGLGIGLSYKTNKLSWIFGINIQHNSHRFNYEKKVIYGGFFLQDTVDVFYTVIQTDTLWTYVTDSTWQPFNQSLTAYDQRNQILMLSMMGKVRFDYLQKRDFDLFVQAGGGIATPLLAHGKTILNQENFPVAEVSVDKLNTVLWNYQLGVGIRVKLDQGFGINASLNYFRQLSGLYKNYPTDRRLNGLLIDLSLSYKL